jgi:hypothetical protein
MPVLEEEWLASEDVGEGRVGGRGKEKRGRTLYVMNTNMRKNDKNTVKPYNTARVIRATKGTGVLESSQK